jgi:hypothetical protein
VAKKSSPAGPNFSFTARLSRTLRAIVRGELFTITIAVAIAMAATRYAMLRHIALVAKTRHVPLTEAVRVAAALQKQVARDASPIWGLQACVSAFASLTEVPIGYWPLIVTDGIHEPGAAGIHLDRHGRPFALVEHGPTWSLSASHECLEMLVDPSGNRQVSGPSPAPGQGEVSFLVEVCDPSEDAQFGYTIDGILLSDFCTPAFFEHAGSGGRYSFTGAIKGPLEILKNGYLSWYDPVGRCWYQEQYFGSNPKFTALGLPGAAYRCMREFANRGEVDHRRLSHVNAASAIMRQTMTRRQQHSDASAAAAELLEEEIAALSRRLAGTSLRRPARRA